MRYTRFTTRTERTGTASELLGIFHIITISGVQMTLVAGIIFLVTRRLLALSPTLALQYPIIRWVEIWPKPA